MVKRSVPLLAALLLAGCGFPYNPRALPDLSPPDPGAAAPAPPYTPPRQAALAATTGQPAPGARPFDTSVLAHGDAPAR